MQNFINFLLMMMFFSFFFHKHFSYLYLYNNLEDFVIAQHIEVCGCDVSNSR